MSPWEVLGWALVAVLALVIAVVSVAAVIGAYAAFTSWWPEHQKKVKRKKADKGKVTCESVEYEGTGADRVRVVCPEQATWRGGFRYSVYLCDTHRMRSRENSAPLAFTERGKAMRRDLPEVVRSPQTPTTSPSFRRADGRS